MIVLTSRWKETNNLYKKCDELFCEKRQRECDELQLKAKKYYQDWVGIIFGKHTFFIAFVGEIYTKKRVAIPITELL